MSCPDCYKGAALSGQPKGALSDVNGAYLASSPTGSSHAVVLLTDIFGLGLPNPKLLADFFSEQLGCDVWVPDLFDGEIFFSIPDPGCNLFRACTRQARTDDDA